MRLLFLSLAFVLANAVIAPIPGWVSSGEESHYMRFSQFITDYSKSYSSNEELIQRFSFFKENMKTADHLNFLHNGTAEFGVTKFCDMSAEEFASKMLSPAKPPSMETMLNYSVAPLQGYDPVKEWTGFYTNVKDQGQVCGSCWSFTALGEMESKLLIAGRGSYTLSTQQLVDCDPYDTGCNGGFYDRAWRYIYETGGVMLWNAYPYVAKKNYGCAFNAGRVAVRLARGDAFRCGNSAMAIYDCISNKGPMAAALDATPLQTYRSGVLSLAASYCSNLNHAVLVVGYNSYGSGFLNVRNSWGEQWGEKGFFRINPTSCLINNFVMGSYV